MNFIDELALEAVQDSYFIRLFTTAERLYWAYILENNGCALQPLTDDEVSDLLAFADILSLSSDASHRNLAVKVIGCLHCYCANDPKYQYFSKGIMLRLGNFPAYELLEKDLNTGTARAIDLEIEKEFKQQINQDETSDKIFTDAQFEVFQALLSRNHFSFSGPTSFGKSFIITSFIKSILLNNKHGTNIAFLVPTRALVSQTFKKFRGILNDVPGYVISASPDIPALLRQKNQHYIFIFTPERLLHYFSDLSNPSIEYVFVDEAQKLLSEDTRAVIYYHAISLAEQNSCKLFFASPNIKNTEIFLQLFNKSTKEKMVVTESPVCQMRMFIDILHDRSTVFSDIGTPYDFELTKHMNLYDLIDTISKRVDPKGYKSLIYCNTIDDTISCAKEMADNISESNSPVLQKAADEISAFIHKEYYLVSLIRKGIGFHFGKLPQKIRDIVERLYESGELHYLFCTSTLLEGVNLPAQNIFILNNQIGNHNFTSVDFWNLAGRAGRLAHELCGNVICVRWSSKEGRWTSDASLELIRSKNIEQIESDVISGNRNFYKNIFNAAVGQPFTRKNLSNEDQKVYKAYSNVLISHFSDNKSSFLRNEFQKRSPDQVPEILKIENRLQIPADIISRFPGIRVCYQEDLWNELPIALKPLRTPSYEHCLDLLRDLFRIYNWSMEESGGTHPLLPRGNPKFLKYYAALMADWMAGEPISQIIASNLKHHIGKRIAIGYQPDGQRIFETFDYRNRKHINIVINNTINDIDTIVRFTLKNYFENYYCILERKFGSQLAGENWSVYMEHGTCNQALIEIQKLGIPRHLSSMVLHDFSECCFFKGSELVSLDTTSMLNRIQKESSDKYDELLQALQDNYIIDHN